MRLTNQEKIIQHQYTLDHEKEKRERKERKERKNMRPEQALQRRILNSQ